MTGDLFPLPCPTHDPRGSNAFTLQPGTRGRATFHGRRDEYRTELWRWWDGADLFTAAGGEPEPGSYVLSIGMNPSTAAAGVDDNTVRIEQRFAREWGFTRYCKANAMDYRATFPGDLLGPGVEPCSDINRRVIADLARGAGLVLLTIGSLPPRLRRHGQAAVQACLEAGKPLWCLGVTADGSPRHVRGLPRDAGRIPFPAERYLAGVAA